MEEIRWPMPVFVIAWVVVGIAAAGFVYLLFTPQWIACVPLALIANYVGVLAFMRRPERLRRGR